LQPLAPKSGTITILAKGSGALIAVEHTDRNNIEKIKAQHNLIWFSSYYDIDY